MNITKTLFATAAAACFSMSASAMQPLAEEQLSDVTGQAISILGNLNVNIGSVVYTDTNIGNEGSFTASNISANGLIAVTLDLLNNANFQADLGALVVGDNPATVATTLAATPFLTVNGALTQDGFYDGVSDVVKIAVPQLNIPGSTGWLLDVSIGEMRMGGGGTATYGSLAVNDINLQGTTVYIWAH